MIAWKNIFHSQKNIILIFFDTFSYRIKFVKTSGFCLAKPPPPYSPLLCSEADKPYFFQAPVWYTTFLHPVLPALRSLLHKHGRYATACWLYRYMHLPALQIPECNQDPVYPYLSVLSAILHLHTV